MIFWTFCLVTPLPVAWQNNTFTPTWVAWQRFPRRKRRLTWQTLPRQCMCRDNVIWSCQRRWHDQKGQIWKYFLGEIIFKILNKKGLKYKNPPYWSGPDTAATLAATRRKSLRSHSGYGRHAVNFLAGLGRCSSSLGPKTYCSTWACSACYLHHPKLLQDSCSALYPIWNTLFLMWNTTVLDGTYLDMLCGWPK
jgi:hypothetical protein